MTQARVVVVACSPRTSPGALSWPAWQALQSGPVLLADAAHRQLEAVHAAGVRTTLVEPDAGALLDRALAEGQLVWLAGSDEPLIKELTERAVRAGVTIEIVYGSYDLPGARLLDVVAVMDRLRSEGGCPWDAKQTHASLMPYLLEEAYETYEALEEGDLVGLREELGDLLLQIAFHARIAAEGGWDIDDVAGDLVDKLVRRHPHVFEGTSADDLEGSWEALKAAEKGRTSVTQGIPMGQPALALAAKLQRRAAKLGATLPSYDGIGGELWELVARCQAEGLDPEAELRAVARTFRDRLAELEHREDGRPVSAEEWDEGFQ